MENSQSGDSRELRHDSEPRVHPRSDTGQVFLETLSVALIALALFYGLHWTVQKAEKSLTKERFRHAR